MTANKNFACSEEVEDVQLPPITKLHSIYCILVVATKCALEVAASLLWAPLRPMFDKRKKSRDDPVVQHMDLPMHK
jgi:hypothetical protein